MALNDNAVYLSEYGAVFYAEVGTALPAQGLKAFSLTADEVASADADKKWKNLGHTSDSNPITIDLEGGDTESLRSWQKTNLKTRKSTDGTMTISVNALQMDEETLKLIYNGETTTNGIGANVNSDGKPLALVIITQESQNAANPELGFHFPKTKAGPSGGPTFGDDFIEQGLSASVESPGGDKKDFEFMFLKTTVGA